MNIGKLRKRIVFEAATAAQDSTGQDIQVWSEVATVWASVEPVKGQTLAVAQAYTQTQTATHKITIRYNSELVGKTRYRIRIGHIGSFPALTGEQFAVLTSAQFVALASSATPARYFTINQMTDNEQRHDQIDILATEVADG